MIFQRFFTPSAPVTAGRALFLSANDRARDPVLYGAGGAPDTYEGRFETLALHVILLLHRLKGDDGRVVETRQSLFDAFIRNLDDGLREMGVGDLSVGKKMRKLGAAVYGRLKSYDQALADGEDAVTPLLLRTVFADADSQGAAVLSRYVVAADAKLAAIPTEDLLKGEASWPPFPK